MWWLSLSGIKYGYRTTCKQSQLPTLFPPRPNCLLLPPLFIDEHRRSCLMPFDLRRVPLYFKSSHSFERRPEIPEVHAVPLPAAQEGTA